MRAPLTLMFCCTFLIVVKYCFADPMRCFKRNEILGCMSPCPEKTCLNRYIQFNCLRGKEDICRVKCVCKEKTYRNSNYDCVSAKECDEYVPE
ncbi:unnamed protein product [Parnassius apollo]|uniref:(apollo) hypothetical protein n=1 Tax=Parnassius apollo TaxID=110799 RepID=A0A8S3WFZ4_PARAO|nr:unnamed protein product [Parnassius apollo]